mmetsp:Transcript_21400/g.53046  ORF Transcript_21400/g.53046 Transcript_21400/m.53046 type:complete len:206 (-) Transcript_21400:83-700(-)
MHVAKIVLSLDGFRMLLGIPVGSTKQVIVKDVTQFLQQWLYLGPRRNADSVLAVNDSGQRPLSFNDSGFSFSFSLFEFLLCLSVLFLFQGLLLFWCEFGASIALLFVGRLDKFLCRHQSHRLGLEGLFFRRSNACRLKLAVNVERSVGVVSNGLSLLRLVNFLVLQSLLLQSHRPGSAGVALDGSRAGLGPVELVKVAFFFGQVV